MKIFATSLISLILVVSQNAQTITDIDGLKLNICYLFRR
jgi:hypothetical protein